MIKLSAKDARADVRAVEKTLRADHPAAQWMLTVHPQRGIARRWKVQIGNPSEGSIYKGRV